MAAGSMPRSYYCDMFLVTLAAPDLSHFTPTPPNSLECPGAGDTHPSPTCSTSSLAGPHTTTEATCCWGPPPLLPMAARILVRAGALAADTTTTRTSLWEMTYCTAASPRVSYRGTQARLLRLQACRG